MINLTRKNVRFVWSLECQNSFDKIKDKLSAIPLLAYPDINKPYTLFTDASMSHVSACLVQEDKPIFFLSHKLSETQQKWSTIEKEGFGIYYALQKLDHYLHNSQFTIVTDHKPLIHILDSPIQNKKIQLWALSISGYNCKIEHLPGKQNVIADFFSRPPMTDKETESESKFEPQINDNPYKIKPVNNVQSLSINVINSHDLDPKQVANKEYEPQDSFVQPIPAFTNLCMKTEQNKDPAIVQIKMLLTHGDSKKPELKKFIIVENILYYLSNPDEEPSLRLYVPTHLRALVIQDYHDNNGHPGTQRMFATVRTKYFWPNLFKELHNYVSTCVDCQTRNLTKVKAPLKETNTPLFPFSVISIDICGPYEKTISNNRYIICFIDVFSGYPEAFAAPDKKSQTVIDLLLNEIYPRYGCPLQIIHDRGSEFMSSAFREVLHEMNIDNVTCTAYHPESNAKQERMHRVLHDILAKRIQGNTRQWDVHLNMSLAGIRFNVSSSSKHSPYYLLYNRDPILPIDNLLKPRAKYHGEDYHKIALEEQHRSFLSAYKHIKHSKRKNRLTKK